MHEFLFVLRLAVEANALPDNNLDYSDMLSVPFYTEYTGSGEYMARLKRDELSWFLLMVLESEGY